MAAIPQAFRLGYRGRFETRTFLFVVVLAGLGFIVLYPIVLLLVNSFQVSQPGVAAEYSTQPWRDALSSPGIRQSLINTAKVVLTVQGISFPIAVVLAWILARTDLPGRGWLEFGFWIPFFIPTLGVTLGWMLMLDPGYGIINSWITKLPFIDSSPFNIYSFWGIVFVHLGTLAVGIKVMLLTPIFRNMDASLEEASRVAGAGIFRTLFRVVIPLMLPALLVILILATVAGMNAFEIEQILGFPARFFVYSTKIFGQVHASPAQYDQATVLGVMILMVMVPLILAQQLVTRSRYTTVTGQIKTQPMQLRRWKWPAFALVCLVLAFITVVPIVFMFMGSFMNLFGFFDLETVWSLRHWGNVLSNSQFLTAFKNTLIVSSGTALGAVTFYTVIAYIIVRTQFFGRRLMSFLSWLPFAIPGVVLGLGFLWFTFSVPILTPLYGSVWLLILVNLLTIMSLGVQIFQSALLNLSMDLEEASRITGAGWWYTFRRVVIPIIMPTVVVVGIIAFVSSARQVATVAILVVGDNHVLSTLQLNFLQGSDFEAAAVIGAIIVLIALSVALVARLLTMRIGLRH